MQERYAVETDVYHAVARIARAAGWFCQRFEDSLAEGIPDLYLARPGSHVWIEVKLGRLNYERGQLPWAVRAADRGEHPLTLLWRPPEHQLWQTDRVALGRLRVAPKPEPLWSGARLADALDAALGYAEGLSRGERRCRA